MKRSTQGKLILSAVAIGFGVLVGWEVVAVVLGLLALIAAVFYAIACLWEGDE